MYFEVQCVPPQVVDIQSRTCSCRLWQVNGLPCPHGAILLFNMVQKPYSYIDKGFYVSSYRQSYSFMLYPFPRSEVQSADSDVTAPIVQKRRGRPKRKGIQSRGEKIKIKVNTKTKKKTKCGKCSEYGYNRMGCTKVM